jgi:phosphatidylinositol alpha-1,6-mannosyltransferase
MRVLFATPDYPPATGGIQTLTHGIVRHRETVDYTVLTFAQEGADDWDRSVDHDVLRQRTVGDHRIDMLALNQRLWREARSPRYDAVVCGHITLAPAASAVRKPWVQWVYAKEIPRRAALSRTFLPRATEVVAISRHARDLATAYGAIASRVNVIPPGTALRYRERTPTAIPSKAPVILHVAQLNEAYKGTDRLIESMPAVRRALPGTRLVVIGEGRRRADLEALAHRTGVQADVDFLGRTSDEVRDHWLATASVFAMPSRMPPKDGGEGFGIVYLEATAAGLPVLAGDVGGARDAVDHERTGLLVDPDSLDAISAGLLRCLTDRGLRSRVDDNAAGWLRGFAWESVTPRVESVLGESIRRGRAAR